MLYQGDPEELLQGSEQKMNGTGTLMAVWKVDKGDKTGGNT